jgi:hypothetical protein
MRLVAAVVLLALASCSAPSYSLRLSSADTLIASNDIAAGVAPPSLADRAAPRRSQAPSSHAPSAATAWSEERQIALVPSVRRGRSTMWKTGAIITVASLGVSLAGAAMTIAGLGDLEHDTGGNTGLFITGFVISVFGDAGMAIAGPAIWSAGIGRSPE